FSILSPHPSPSSPPFPSPPLFRPRPALAHLEPVARPPVWKCGRVRGFAPDCTARLLRGDREAARRRALESIDDAVDDLRRETPSDRKSTRLNSSHVKISYAALSLK